MFEYPVLFNETAIDLQCSFHFFYEAVRLRTPCSAEDVFHVVFIFGGGGLRYELLHL